MKKELVRKACLIAVPVVMAAGLGVAAPFQGG